MKKVKLLGLMLLVGTLGACNNGNSNVENDVNSDVSSEVSSEDNQQDEVIENEVDENDGNGFTIPVNLDGGGNDLTALTYDEMEAYENFKADYDNEELKILDPLSIMKIYLYSGVIGDYETQYELHTDKDPLWTKEEHLEFSENDRISSANSIKKFQNVYGVDMVYSDGIEDCVISWYSENDNVNGQEPLKHGFKLVVDVDVWKVEYMPLQ